MSKRNTLRILITTLFCGLNLLTAGSVAARQSSAALPTSKSQETPMTKMKDSSTQESPFACNVGALNAEQRQRYTALIKKLNISKQDVRELPDGYAFQFSAESSTVQELAEFIVFERLCCPFFDFEIAVEREGGPVWLRLRGREGVKEFIRIEFGVK